MLQLQSHVVSTYAVVGCDELICVVSVGPHFHCQGRARRCVFICVTTALGKSFDAY